MLLQSSFLLAQAFSKPESLPGGLDHPRPTGGADLSDDAQVRLRSLSMLEFRPGPWPMGGADLSNEALRRSPMLGSDPGALPNLASAPKPRPSFDCWPEPDVGEAETFSGPSTAAAAAAAAESASRAMDDRKSNFQRLWSDSLDCSAWMFEQSAQPPLA